MAMRPEDIEALLAQLGPAGKSPGMADPLASALGKYTGGMGAGALPGPPPAPLPKMGADRNMMPVPPPEQYPSGPTGLPPGYQSPNDIPEDEAMLDQVQQGMGGNGEDGGDMEAAADDLVAMYENGDPSDPATLEQWRAAKEDFISKYGKENLPSLPNDPDEDEEGGLDAQYDLAEGGEGGESQRQQSTGEFESFRKRHRRTIS